MQQAIPIVVPVAVPTAIAWSTVSSTGSPMMCPSVIISVMGLIDARHYDRLGVALADRVCDRQGDRAGICAGGGSLEDLRRAVAALEPHLVCARGPVRAVVELDEEIGSTSIPPLGSQFTRRSHDSSPG